ncbi:PREDICTED: zinc finger CCCH domain-containing protein 66-like isoform X2 [Ipomoea nil]|uniref:zinc finger CCCH domain-containing protein 66-like isoform X2 n=1 Tax=Ipomoea nil TaxID=35883 RepID=UPI0009011578|nr:PREDICTED: zinc finger CCCH domain-containing protein 66-like isoform X2 [Ipomoea nil]
MCSGSRRKEGVDDLGMEGEAQKQEGFMSGFSVLLEFSAADDLDGFRKAVEEEGCDINESGLWYGRRIGSRKMGNEERTPLLIASYFGSKRVLSYILEKGCVDVNRACGSDGATALHCAVAGGSLALPEVVKLLLDASADAGLVDANGKRAADLIAPGVFGHRRKTVEHLLKGKSDVEESQETGGFGLIDRDTFEQIEEQKVLSPIVLKDGSEKKEYPIDPSLPDIKNGIYGTDEFRMYTFKVKPCSRAYSHDWTECPFVHPGENARRRDPRKFHYTCVPCPDFRKGTCQRGDSCEYAHGIFECWLHPAQYRTRMCKDESSCNRRVCFFAHRPEELRPLYASIGSAVPSPRSYSLGASPLDIASVSPLALGSPSMMIAPTSTPPLTPSGPSSPRGRSLWPNQISLATPTLQLPGSRLKTSIHARDSDLDSGLLGLMDEISVLSSPSSQRKSFSTAPSGDLNGEMSRHPGLNPTNLDDIFETLDPNILAKLQGLLRDNETTHLQSPKGMHLRQNFVSGYPSPHHSSSPVRTPSFQRDPSSAALNAARSAAFAKRSQSFIDRSAPCHHHGMISSPMSPVTAMPSTLSGWGSPDGKLDWGMQKDELSKLRKSASFGIRSSSGTTYATTGTPFPTTPADEPDVSWVQSLVRDTPAVSSRQGSPEMHPTWGDQQIYMEQEQIMA